MHPIVLYSVKGQGLGGQRTCNPWILIQLGAMDDGAKEHAAIRFWIQPRAMDEGGKEHTAPGSCIFKLFQIDRHIYYGEMTLYFEVHIQMKD